LSTTPQPTPPATAANAAAGPARRGSSRDPWLDNARLIAALLIVVTHFGDTIFVNSEPVQHLYFATWPMRVPLYALIAGYFSSAEPLGGRRAVALVRNVLFVYIAFDLIATVQEGLLGRGWKLDIALPAFALWFLLSLFIWRLLLPVLSKIRFILPISVVVALAAGFMPAVTPNFSASRTLCFLPIFLLGWKLKEAGLHRVLDRRSVRAAAVAFLVLFWSLTVFLVQNVEMKRTWTTMRKGYPGDFDAQVDGMLIRMAVIAAGMLGALAMLALTPRTRIPFVSYLGTGSLYIYLLHPIVLKQVTHAGIPGQIDSRVEVVAFLCGAALLGVLLGTPPVRKVTRWLIQPRYTWIFEPTGRDLHRVPEQAVVGGAAAVDLAKAPAPVVAGAAEAVAAPTGSAAPR
jgi:fucose 4-O-acetylase-like acetyltransferase